MNYMRGWHWNLIIGLFIVFDVALVRSSPGCLTRTIISKTGVRQRVDLQPVACACPCYRYRQSERYGRCVNCFHFSGCLTSAISCKDSANLFLYPTRIAPYVDEVLCQ